MLVQTIVFICFTILKVSPRCDSPSRLEFVGFQSRPRRSLAFSVEATAIKCPGLRFMYYEWTILQKETASIFKKIASPSITIHGYDFHPVEAFQREFVLSVRVSHNSNMTPFSKKSRPFFFLPDKMHVQIVGGSEKTHPCGTDLIVDAQTLSKDDTFTPDENPFEGNRIQWFVRPPLGESDKLTMENLLLKIPGNLLLPGLRYVFTVKMTRTKVPNHPDEGTATQIVNIVSSLNPEFHLECTHNCIQSHPEETTCFKVICMNNCHDSNYTWSLIPSLEDKRLDFGNGHDQLIVVGRALRSGDRLDVRVTTDENNLNKSFSSMTVNFIRDIKKGTCDIEPKKGTSGLTKFQVSCKGFQSSESQEDLLYMIYQKDDDGSEGVLLNEDVSPVSEVYLSEGNPTLVKIAIQDRAFVQTELDFEVEVKPFIPETRNASALDVIVNLIMGENLDGSLPTLAEAKWRNGLVQTVSFLLNALDKESDKSVKKGLHKRIAEAVKKVTPVNFSSALQIISILGKMNRFRVPTDTGTARVISSIVKDVVLVLHGMVKDKQENVPHSILRELDERIFRLSAALMKQVEELKKSLERDKTMGDYDSRERVASDTVEIRRDMNSVTENSILSMKIIGTDIISENLVDQKAVDLLTEVTSFTARRIRPKSFSELNVTIPGSTKSFVRLSRDLVAYLDDKYDFVDFQFTAFKTNPFWWHKKSSILRTDLISFDLFKRWEKIDEEKHSIHLSIRTKSFPVGVLTGDLNNGKTFEAHRVELEEGEKLVVTFQAGEESFKVVGSYCYCLEEDFSRGVEIRGGTEDAMRTVQMEAGDGNSAVYICVKKTGTAALTYTGFYAAFSCIYWVPKSGDWSSAGCKVVTASLVNGSDLKCECLHSSLFTGSITMPDVVVYSDIGVHLYVTFTRNWTAVVPPVIVFTVWFFLLLWARKIDKKFEKENVICILDDNMPGDKHVYLMVIFTGFYLYASPTSDVAFQVLGSQSDSRVHIVKSVGHDLLHRNGQDWILFYTPRPLGKIKTIRIWHNSKGQRPHWYCSRIIIHHITTGYQVFFNVNDWFSLIYGDGKVYREIKPLTQSQLKSPTLLIPLKFERLMRNNNLWLSVWTRDPQSNFTSVQRVSCCIAFVSLSMTIVFLLYCFPQGSPVDSIDRNISEYLDYIFPVKILLSFFISSTIMLLIVLLFTRSRPDDPKIIKIYDSKYKPP